jgi:hypothetical protein
MITTENKFYTKELFWFDLPTSFSNKIDLVELKSSHRKVSILSISSHTLFVNLLENESDIFKNIKKTTKYEINRALDKDQINCSFNYHPNIYDIEIFENFYNKFAKRSGLGKLNINIISRYLLNDKIILTSASFNNKILVYHCYLNVGKMIRLLKSANNFDEENISKNIVSRANRLLHWKDILEFKEQNFNIYDFGGIYLGKRNKKLISITEFKLNFSQHPIELYDCIKPITIVGFIVSPLIYIKRLFVLFKENFYK